MGFFDVFKGAGKKTGAAASGAAPGGGSVTARPLPKRAL